MVEQVQVNKREIGLVFEDKKGLHEFLTVEMEYFLPSYQYVSIDWLRDIWSGTKTVSAWRVQ